MEWKLYGQFFLFNIAIPVGAMSLETPFFFYFFFSILRPLLPLQFHFFSFFVCVKQLSLYVHAIVVVIAEFCVLSVAGEILYGGIGKTPILRITSNVY